MRSSLRQGWWVVVAAAIVALPVLPPAAAGPSDTLPVVHAGSQSDLPAAVLAPWSARVGYDPAYVAEVPLAQLDLDRISVVVHLAPQDPGFYLPAPAGSPGLTGGTIAERYGRTSGDYAALLGYFEDHGAAIARTSPERLDLTLEGPAPAIGAAFGTTILTGTWEGRTVHFPASVPALPSPFAAEVSSVVGLSDGFTRFAFSLVPAEEPAAVAAPLQGRTSTLVTPSAAHLLYGLSDLYNYSGSPHFATGVGIAVVLWGDGYAPSDITTFFANEYPAGFPSVTVTGHPVSGAPVPSASAPNDPSQAPQELTLDIEWAASMAPGAAIHAVYAPDGPASNSYSPSDADLENAFATAVDLTGVDVVSMSFGTPDGADSSLQAAFAQTIATATQRGITVLAASGDNAGTVKGGCQGGPSPEFPAASPGVLAVGGTAPVESLDAFGTVTGLDAEPAWNGSGGGYSTVYAAPSWQEVGSATGPIASHGTRGIPDVAGPAFDNYFYFDGGDRAGRGTSFATPMWAGLVAEIDALLGRPVGFLTERLYGIGAQEENGQTGIGLVDITSGANCLATAVTGWDSVTGWGSPRAVTLYQDLSSSFVGVALTTSSDAVAPGSAVSATVLVTNATSHAAIPGLPVGFTLTALGYSGPCGGTMASVAATTDLNGSATAALTVPGCFLGSSALLSVTVSGNGYFGNNSTRLTVNLVGLAGFLAGIQTFPYNVIAFIVIVAIAVALGYWIGERRRPRRPRAVRYPVAAAAPASANLPPVVPPSSGAALDSGPPVRWPPDPGPSGPPPGATDPVGGFSSRTTGDPPPAIDDSAATPGRDPALQCPHCSAPIAVTDAVCPACGSPLGSPPPGDGT